MLSFKKQYSQVLIKRYFPGIPLTLSFFLFMCSSHFSHSQSLKLYNVNTAQSGSIVSTKNVSIITYDKLAERIKDDLFIVNDSTIRIDSMHLSLSDKASIKAITNKSRMWGYIFAGGSAFFWAQEY